MNEKKSESGSKADEEPWAQIATNKQQNSTILFLQINLVVKDQTTDRSLYEIYSTVPWLNCYVW